MAWCNECVTELQLDNVYSGKRHSRVGERFRKGVYFVVVVMSRHHRQCAWLCFVKKAGVFAASSMQVKREYEMASRKTVVAPWLVQMSDVLRLSPSTLHDPQETGSIRGTSSQAKVATLMIQVNTLA